MVAPTKQGVEIKMTNDMIKRLEQYSKDGHIEFLANLKKSNIMEMRFNRGEVIIVEVIEEDAGSDENDRKYVVKILYVINPSDITSPYHKPGSSRWVRTYDLKRVGHYNKEVA